MALFSQATVPRVGLRSTSVASVVPVLARPTPLPIRGTIARPVPIAPPVIRGGFSPTVPPPQGTRAPVIAPARPPMNTIRPVPIITAPVSIVRGPNLPVGMPIARPVAGAPITAALRPTGGNLGTQPAGSPPSGAPPSMSMITNQAGVIPPAPDFFSTLSAPLQLGSFSLPGGWLALGAIVLVVVLVARRNN